MLPELSIVMMISTGLTSSIASYFCTPHDDGLIVHITEQPPSGPLSAPSSHSSLRSTVPSPHDAIVQSGLQGASGPFIGPSSQASPGSTTPSPQVAGVVVEPVTASVVPVVVAVSLALPEPPVGSPIEPLVLLASVGAPVVVSVV